MQSPPFAHPLPVRDQPSPSDHSSLADDAAQDADADALVPRTARRIAALLSDLKRELQTLHHAKVDTHGRLHIVVNLPSRTTAYALDAVSHDARVSIAVEAASSPNGDATAANGTDAHPPPTTTTTATRLQHDATATPSRTKRTRRDSDSELEKELVPRKRQRPAPGDDHGDSMQHAISVENIVAKLRDDIQEDTSECVNHVQKLLRRFKEEWHEKSTWDFEHMSSGQTAHPISSSVVENGTAPAAAFPSPLADQDDQDITAHDLIKQESRLVSSQIRWVEECRRIASEAHDKREENWRTSSATFHDKVRQDRENFQGRILHEQGVQSQVLNQILNEVKQFGLYMHSMKWETPGSLAVSPPYHHMPVAPAFPTQPPPLPSRGRGRGNVRGR